MSVDNECPANIFPMPDTPSLLRFGVNIHDFFGVSFALDQRKICHQQVGVATCHSTVFGFTVIFGQKRAGEYKGIVGIVGCNPPSNDLVGLQPLTVPGGAKEMVPITLHHLF